jgi:hypothetical protein
MTSPGLCTEVIVTNSRETIDGRAPSLSTIGGGTAAMVIVRPEGPTTMEDLERENRALIKSQQALFAGGNATKKQVALLEAENESARRAAAQARMRVSSLEMELQTLADRLSQSPYRQSASRSRQKVTHQMRGAAAQGDAAEDDGDAYEKEERGGDDDRSIRLFSEDPASMSLATMTNAAGGGAVGAAASASQAQRSLHSTQLLSTNSTVHTTSTMRELFARTYSSPDRFADTAGSPAFPRGSQQRRPANTDDNNNEWSPAPHSVAGVSTADDPLAATNLQLHPQTAEQRSDPSGTVTATGGATTTFGKSGRANNSHSTAMSPSPASPPSNITAGELESSRALLCKSATPEAFNGRVWERTDDVWTLKAELQTVWESRRRFDQLLKAALVRLRDAETEIEVSKPAIERLQSGLAHAEEMLQLCDAECKNWEARYHEARSELETELARVHTLEFRLEEQQSLRAGSSRPADGSTSAQDDVPSAAESEESRLRTDILLSQEFLREKQMRSHARALAHAANHVCIQQRQRVGELEERVEQCALRERELEERLQREEQQQQQQQQREARLREAALESKCAAVVAEAVAAASAQAGAATTSTAADEHAASRVRELEERVAQCALRERELEERLQREQQQQEREAAEARAREAALEIKCAAN